MANQVERMCQEEDLSSDIKDWSKHQVKEWVLKLDGMDSTVAQILVNEEINGACLLDISVKDLRDIGVKFGHARLLIHARDEVLKLRKEEPAYSRNQPEKPCKPYPFCRYHDTFRYMEDSILDVRESNALDLIEPHHEFKAFINTPDETKANKFISDVIHFAAACMNSRTNGTIHFGIGDKREGYVHGQVLGVIIGDIEAYVNDLKSAINAYFEHKHKHAAQMCIKHPRFVGVLNKNITSSDKCVIEVDIVPQSAICKENIYHTYPSKKFMKEAESQASKCFFVRDSGSSKDLLAQPETQEYEQFTESVSTRSNLRKQAEAIHLSVLKSSTQGSRLCHIITGGSLSLDKSNFEQYVIVTNKSHPSQFDSLQFLVDLDPTAVLDFDPESAKHGLKWHFDEHSTVNPHFPSQYQITEGAEDIANRLNLTRNTSWVFCNGGIETKSPSDNDQWLKKKETFIQDVISFLCRKDILPNERFLVIFLILSRVSDKMDPLVETFATFWQELGSTEQIICICDNEKTFTSLKDLIEARCGVNISDKCIYELSFAEVNGTILSLWSENRRSKRFLPCGGGGKVLLERKMERSLNILDVLCVNQCEGGNGDEIAIEENFYKGKISWWNFYFSEQPGSTPFIKRDCFDYIKDTVIPDLCSMRNACVLFNLIHLPGCGGTTLAMHILWALRDRFRCAVLKNISADFAEVADQVIKLLLYDHGEQAPRVPVLLMIDNFDNMDKVLDLQLLIDSECADKNIPSKSAQVILLNCMRSELSETTKQTADTLFIGSKLSENEQKMFEEKLQEIKKTHENAEKLYGFMIMKENFKSEYIKEVVHHTLKSFDINQKNAQLLAILVLLDVYCKGTSLSISLCEEFLGLQSKPVCGTTKIEQGFGEFSTLITRCSVEGKIVFSAVKVIHPRISRQCLQELTTTHKVKKADIVHLLLATDELYVSTQGKDNLMQDVCNILVKKYHTPEESKFTPLIQDIIKETPGLEETVLKSASKRFEKDATVSQLLARYYYLKKKDFSEAKFWAEKAKALFKDSSNIADTSAQVMKHELNNFIVNLNGELISPDKLRTFLEMAESTIDAFKETQNLAKQESLQRISIKTDNSHFNTLGYLGEIQVESFITNVLEKIPVFSSDSNRQEIMRQVLSGDIQLDRVEREDPWKHRNRPYYVILQKFEYLLYTLKHRMKANFDFLDSLHVNLGSRFGMKDNRDQLFQNELFRCFKQYAKIFCKSDSESHLKNKTLHIGLKLLQTRQSLEKEKVDTHCGILNCLSKGTSAEMMEMIARQYSFVCKHDGSPTERVNLIYVHVVLSCIKPDSQQLQPYPALTSLLLGVLREEIHLADSLALHFIAIVLLWPQSSSPVCKDFQSYISQMKTSYNALMKEVYNGKSPIIHFLLGKKQGYERLVHVGKIKKGLKAGQKQLISLWRSGKIWKEETMLELLCRVTGEVTTSRDCILADTCFLDLRVEVSPMYPSQISGLAEGSKVSFFIGFSIKGPLAFDIELL
ncbi:sterile alpha motif domain-containing protein 9-like [Pholidichthys leucotaenia]